MKFKRTVLGPVLVAMVAVICGGWLLQRGVAQQGGVFQQARIFEEVVQYLSNRYVDERPQSELYQMAIEGLLDELDDPHTSFMSAEEYNSLRIQTTGEYGGLGIEIVERDDWVTVLSVIPGTPAERAGLLAGDRIIRIEDESTEGWTTEDVVEVLRGPKGEPANIRVARIGVDEPIPFSVVRDEIHINSVPYAYMVEDGVGYVKLKVFSETAAEEVHAAVERLREQGMERLILDLRENPGGLLDQGIAVPNLFLDEGAPISETRSRNPEEDQTFRAMNAGPYTDLPMAVLVDGYSASASEITAGALQDNDRALVLGTPSFGKGSVQTLLPLSGGNFLKMTTGRWYTPVGRSINKDRSDLENEMALFDEEPIAEDGSPVTPREVADTVAERETYQTLGGRTVYGGGGIVPDLIIRPDTLTVAEQEFFADIVSKEAGTYWDVVYQYALEYVQEHPNLRPEFEVTAAMRGEFLQQLRAAGVEVEEERYEAASSLVDRQLLRQIALDKFGRAIAERRSFESDKVIERAVELLEGSSSQQALFRAAEMRAERAAAQS